MIQDFSQNFSRKESILGTVDFSKPLNYNYNMNTLNQIKDLVEGGQHLTLEKVKAPKLNKKEKLML